LLRDRRFIVKSVSFKRIRCFLFVVFDFVDDSVIGIPTFIDNRRSRFVDEVAGVDIIDNIVVFVNMLEASA
jgi:hypothetical protein